VCFSMALTTLLCRRWTRKSTNMYAFGHCDLKALDLLFANTCAIKLFGKNSKFLIFPVCAQIIADLQLLPLCLSRKRHLMHSIPNHPPQISSAFFAMSIAPSKVLFPPMNPAAWTKTHPLVPQISSSPSSRKPLQASGSGFRL